LNNPTVVTTIELVQNFNVPRVAGGANLYRIQTEREKLITVYIKSEQSSYLLNQMENIIKIPSNTTMSFYFKVVPIEGIDILNSDSPPPTVTDFLEIKYIDPQNGDQMLLSEKVEVDKRT